MASQTRSPGTIVSGGDGDGTWDNPGNAASSNDTYASTQIVNNISDSLRATNFGFSIPSGSTIDGIEISIEMSGDGAGSVIDENVLIRGYPGGTTPNDQANGTEFGIWEGAPNEQVFDYGSPTTLWITPGTWTSTDINDSAFGVQFQSREIDDKVTDTLCDHISITVYYTEPTPTYDQYAAWSRGSNILIQPSITDR